MLADVFCIFEEGKSVVLNLCCCVACGKCCYNELRAGQEERVDVSSGGHRPLGEPIVMAMNLPFPRADVSSRSTPATVVSLRLLTSTLGMNSHPTSLLR